jgi:uncharacterized membrane protein YgcG
MMIFMLSCSICVDAAPEEQYTNGETGYKILVMDDANILTSDEEKQLVQDIIPVTVYGNAAVWTTEEYTDNELEQARLKRKELFVFDSACIFVINMNKNVRKLTIQSYGTINEFVTDSFARSITDNVKGYATSGDYYVCCKTAFSQILAVCENRHISEPLKISGYFVISLMAGLIISISLAFSKRQNALVEYNIYEDPQPYKIEGEFTTPINAVYVSQTTVYRPPVSSSSSSGSSCSSCSSGSSCSSCSSCGGGGCGSGGSSSF